MQNEMLTYRVTAGDAPEDFVKRTLIGVGARARSGGLYTMTPQQASSARGIFMNSDYSTSIDQVKETK